MVDTSCATYERDLNCIAIVMRFYEGKINLLMTNMKETKLASSEYTG